MATIEDVARLAGVSKATVSRVLSGRAKEASVRDETRQRIEKAAAELSYRPSLFARGLKTKRTRLIGVVARDLTNPFWAGIVEGITRSCHERGYHVTLTHALSESEQVAEGTLLTRMGWDGLCSAATSAPRSTSSRSNQFLEQVRGVVGVARPSDGIGFPTVRSDNALGVRQALDLLYSLGHRRIGVHRRRQRRRRRALRGLSRLLRGEGHSAAAEHIHSHGPARPDEHALGDRHRQVLHSPDVAAARAADGGPGLDRLPRARRARRRAGRGP